VWNVSRIGAEQDGPPELLFVRGARTDKVGDLEWKRKQDHGPLARARHVW
jgi:hypothetical protein